MSYNGNDFMKASKLAIELKFEEVNITDNHMETSLVLFMDEYNGTWSVEGSYNGRYRLCYDYETLTVNMPISVGVFNCYFHNQIKI